MTRKHIYFIALNAILAALYAALTLLISPIAYGEIQFRLTEILIFLAFFDVRFLPGLILGCFIANLFSPMLVWDVSFGTAATAVAVTLIWLIGKLTKEKDWGLFLVPVAGAAANGLLVGLALHFAFDLPFWEAALYVALGEGAVLIAGAFVFMAIRKVPAINKFLNWIE